MLCFAAVQLNRNPMSFSWCCAHVVAHFFLLLLSTSAVAVADHGYPFHLGPMHSRRGDDIPARGILDRSVQAIGGQNALDFMKTVSLHALYVSRILVQWSD
jgi:hypothetical protein